MPSFNFVGMGLPAATAPVAPFLTFRTVQLAFHALTGGHYERTSMGRYVRSNSLTRGTLDEPQESVEELTTFTKELLSTEPLPRQTRRSAMPLVACW